MMIPTGGSFIIDANGTPPLPWAAKMRQNISEATSHVMKDFRSKRLVMSALAQFLLAVIVAFTTGTVWLINGSMLRSSPPTGVQQFDSYLTVGFVASVVLIIVAAFHLDGARRAARRSQLENAT